MKRKRAGFTLLFLIATAAVVAFLLAKPPRSMINRDNFNQITDGMTLKEVEEVLGGPERDETNGSFPTVAIMGHSGVDMNIALSDTSKQWNGPEGWVCVDFDNQGQACYKYFVDGHWLRPTWVDYVKEFFGVERSP